MYEPKEDLTTILNTISGITVYQDRPEVIEDRPSITFSISNNVPEFDLSKEVARENIEVTIHIWALTSIESGQILKELVDKMLENNYVLTFNTDMIDEDGGSHIVTKFTY